MKERKKILISQKNLASFTKIFQRNMYQLLFVLSQTLFYSIDLWLYLFLVSSQNLESSSLGVLGLLSLEIIQWIVNIISGAIGIYSSIRILILRKSTYSIQILQKILFPILVLILTVSLCDPRRNLKAGSPRENVWIRGVFAFNTIFLLSFLMVKNYRLDLRYVQSNQKGLNRLFNSQYVLLFIKLKLTFLFSVFLPDQRLISLIVYSALNITINMGFNFKTLYENPNIQYLSLISQFFLWLPTLCGFLQYCNLGAFSVWIIYVIGLSFYLTVSFGKPRFLLFILQRKYLKNISAFSAKINQQNFKDTSKIKTIASSAICYMSIARNLLLQQQNNQLQWSQPFIAQVFRTLKLDIAIIKKKIDSERQTPSNNRNCYFANQTANLNLNNCKAFNQQLDLKYLKHQNIQEPQDIFDEMNDLMAEWLFKTPQCPNQLKLYACYNFIDSTNKMKHRIFYSFFTVMSNSKNLFSKINSQICYDHLLEKINHQKSQNHNQRIKSGTELNYPGQIKRDEIVQQSVGSKHESCLGQFCSNFNEKFNDVIEEKSIYFQIISGFEGFIKNQEKYLKSYQQNKRASIRKYLHSRNNIRKAIQEQIKNYSRLSKHSLRHHILIILNYIRDFYLRQDPVIAYDKFFSSLSNLAHSVDTQISIPKRSVFESHNGFNNMLCVITAIKQPDMIFTSCPQFKRLLEIQDKNMNFEAEKLRSKHKNNKIISGEQSNFKLKLNDFLLPLWKQQHQKIINKQFICEPIDHFNKRYFLESKNKANILEVKFKMYFHMLYQNDMLIILDMEQQNLKDLQIFNQDKKQLLYSHKKDDQFSSGSFYSKNSDKKASHSELEDKLREKINEVNKLMRSQPKQKSQKIEIFRNVYHIISSAQSFQKGLIQKALQVQKNSLVDFEKFSYQEENQICIKEIEQKQRRFFNHKNNFTFKQKSTTLLFFFYILSIGVAVFLLNIYQQTELKILNHLALNLKDKILTEDDFAKEQLYKMIDIGMFSNMYQKQIDIQLLSTIQRTFLFERLISSATNSILTMKKRHSINPSAIIKGARSQIFLNPSWIPGSNFSFQIKIFRNQFKYLEILQSYTNLTETYKSTNGKSTDKNISLTVNLTQNKFTPLKKYINEIFLKSALENLIYITNQDDGVFVQYRKQEKKLFQTQNLIQTKNFLIFILIILTNSIFGLILVLYLVFEMISIYWTAGNTSKNFMKSFGHNIKQLRFCVEELSKFSKQSMRQIVKPIQINYRQVEKEKIVAERQLKKQKVYKLVAKTTKQDVDADLANKNFSKAYSELCDVKNRQINKNCRWIDFGRFTVSRLMGPFVRMIVLFTIFFLVFDEGRRNRQTLDKYQAGLTELTFVEVSLLNLLSKTLFITNFRQQDKAQNSQTIQSALTEQFSESVTKVSAKDKIKIVENLFNNDPQKEHIVSRILYRPVCQQFKNQIQCPQIFADKVNGLYEKYGQVIKNLNVLYYHLNSAEKTVLGTLNTTTFQGRYIENYYSMQELMYISRKMKIMSFERLKLSLSLDEDSSQIGNGRFRLLICLLGYLILDATVILGGVYREKKVIEEEFLRIGNYGMFKGQHDQFDGYSKFINKAQYHSGQFDTLN